MLSRDAVLQLSNPIDGVFDGFKDDLKEGFQEVLVEGVETGIENVNEIIEEIILLIITPPLPDGAAVYVDGVEGSSFFSQFWDEIIEFNEFLTQLTIGLFGLFFIIYLIGLGVGVVSQSDMAQSFFIMLIGFVLLVNNAEVLNLAWALIYAVTDAIITFPIGDSNTGTSIAGGLTISGTIGGAATAGLAMKFGAAIILIPVLILILFFLITLLFVQLIAVIGYAAFPVIIGLWLVGMMFESVQSYTNKINGFFIPAMYASIPLAMVFKVASMFVGTGLETDGAGEFLGSAALSIFGPFFTLGAIIIGVFIVLKSFQAGSVVVGAASTAVVGGATVGLAAATGGIGAAAKGFAMRGTPGAAAGAIGHASGGGGGSGASMMDYNDAPELTGESSESSSGVLGGISDFGKSVDRKIMSGATDRLESAGQSVSERMPDSIVNTSDSSPSAIIDRVTGDGEGALGKNDVVTDPQVGLEKIKENKEKVTANIEEGAVGVEDAAGAMIDAQIDQMGLTGSDATELKEFQFERLASLQDTEHPFKSSEQTDAEAFEKWSSTSFDDDVLANMGLSGTLNGGQATSGQGVVSTLDSQFTNKNSRQEFRANPMAGLTSDDKDQYGAEFVSFGGVVDGNEKSERLQYSTDAITQQEYASSTPKFRMEGRDDGMIEYGFDPDIIPDDVPSDHAIYNAEQTGDGTFIMSAEEFKENMDVIPFGEIDAVGDRESAVLLENSIKDTERTVQENLKSAADLESAEGATLDNLLEGRLSISDLFEGDTALDNVVFARGDHTAPSVDDPKMVSDSRPPIGEVDQIEGPTDPYKGPLEQSSIDQLDFDDYSVAFEFDENHSENVRVGYERLNARASESEIVFGRDNVDTTAQQQEVEQRISDIERSAAEDTRRIQSTKASALRRGAFHKFGR